MIKKGDKDFIFLDDIKEIIKKELKDISEMKPDVDENEITLEVMKLHYSTECRVILNCITDFIREQEAAK